ncbi:MAG: LysE family translocator [Nitrososphaerota archaeon]
MDWPQLIMTVILVSASGALAPGPLLVATLSESIKRGASVGLHSATGHMVVELPLVILIAQGLVAMLEGSALARLTISVLGVLALVFFGLMQIRGALTRRPADLQKLGTDSPRSGMLIGIIFTGLNPYFIAWWLTIGARLISDSFAMAAWTGVAVMYMSHIWIDYAWLYSMSAVAWRGSMLIRSRFLRIMNLVLGALLILLALFMSQDLFSIVFS